MGREYELGSVLSMLMEHFFQSPDEVSLLAVLKCLRESEVFTALADDRPQMAEQDDRRWLCVYSTAGQIPPEARLCDREAFLSLLMRASSDPSIDGLIVDLETHPFRIPRNFYDLLFKEI